MRSSNGDDGTEELGRDRLGEPGAWGSGDTDHGPSVHAGVGRLMRRSLPARFDPAEPRRLSGSSPASGTSMQRVTRLISADRLASNTSLVGCCEGSGGGELGRGRCALSCAAAKQSIRRCRSTLPREKVCTGLRSAACEAGRRLSRLVGALDGGRYEPSVG